MSVLIKGMEMPKNCDECPCYYETEGAWRNECEVLGKEYIADDYRPEWCPLVEIPAGHGRLIDADALRQSMYHEAFETDSPMQKWDSGCWIRYKMFERLEGNAPTVIEAEGASE